MIRSSFRYTLTALFLVLSILLSGAFTITEAASDDINHLYAIEMNPLQNTLSVSGSRPLTTFNEYSVLKLMNPSRLVIDLPDSDMALPVDTVPVDHPDILRVEVTQKRGMFYKAVRITVYAKNDTVLQRLKTSVSGNALQIHLEDIQAEATLPSKELGQASSQANKPLAQGALANPSILPLQTGAATAIPDFLTPSLRKWDNPLAIPKGRNVINDIYYRDQQLVIFADPDHADAIRVANRFVLRSPTRLVIDLDNAMVASKALQGSIGVNDDPRIRQIRIGQFDETTVRIVIETPTPERFNVYYPSTHKKLMAISSSADVNITHLPRDVQLGTLEQISLDKESGVTRLRLTASAPVIHRLFKRAGKVQIELLNIAARPGWVGFDQKNFPQIKAMNVETLAVGQPNSKFIIDLENPYWAVDSKVGSDGRTLDILLQERNATTLTKVPFKARVVVDAGHGGKDQGASREGILEKDLNLKLALKLKKALEARGITVYMTRTTDKYLTLKQITQVNNYHHPDAFVSIHHNASKNPAISGVETYYYTPQSKPLAQKVHRSMVSTLGVKHRGTRRAMFYVIHHTRVPAILCEVGYLSNAQERRELVSERRQNAQINAIAEGVVEYLKSRLSAQAR